MYKSRRGFKQFRVLYVHDKKVGRALRTPEHPLSGFLESPLNELYTFTMYTQLSLHQRTYSVHYNSYENDEFTQYIYNSTLSIILYTIAQSVSLQYNSKFARSMCTPISL